MIKTAAELTDFSRGEECQLEAQIKAIADTGVKVVVSGGKIGDLALHYLNKYKLMAVRLTSKWDVRRLCKAVNATPLPKMTPPTQEELGLIDRAYVDELGDTSVVIFRMHESAKDTGISTVVVRGATDNYMDDIERAVDDGVNTFKGICRVSNVQKLNHITLIIDVMKQIKNFNPNTNLLIFRILVWYLEAALLKWNCRVKLNHFQKPVKA